MRLNRPLGRLATRVFAANGPATAEDLKMQQFALNVDIFSFVGVGCVAARQNLRELHPCSSNTSRGAQYLSL